MNLVKSPVEILCGKFCFTLHTITKIMVDAESLFPSIMLKRGRPLGGRQSLYSFKNIKMLIRSECQRREAGPWYSMDLYC